MILSMQILKDIAPEHDIIFACFTHAIFVALRSKTAFS